MFDITTLDLSQEILSKNGLTIATQIKALNPYRDGHTVPEEIIGRRVTVVFPSAGYQTLDVKVSDPTDALSVLLNRGQPVYVVFDNFEAKIYDFTDRVTGKRRLGISAKATAVRVIDFSDDEKIVI